MSRHLFPIVILAAISLSACVTRKKHDEALGRYRTALDMIIDSLDQQKQLVAILDSSLIFSEGTSAGLAQNQERLLNRLQAQTLQMRDLENDNSTARTTLQTDIQNLREEKAALNNQFNQLQNGFQAALTAFNQEGEQVVTRLVAELSAELAGERPVEMQLRSGAASLIVPEIYLFRSGSSSRLVSEHERVLAAVAQALEAHPLLKLRVAAHTDNGDGRSDQWAFAADRAGLLVRKLTDDYYQDAGRMSAVSYGEYVPLVSNASAEGRTKNRRIEFVFFRELSALERELRALTDRPD